MQVILPATDEPVRRGGWVLTDDGWVPEDGITAEDQEPAEPPAENEE